ncbi:MAG: hypothetical protein U0412_03290 [Nitrospira sp.]
MSRRYSDAPINLIARIPTPEQISAARPKKRSLGQAVMESGAACVRGLADLGAHLYRLLQAGSSRSALSSVPDGEACRIEGSIADFETPVARLQPPSEEPRIRPAATVPASTAQQEVAMLRAELAAQQAEIDRLSAHVQELKSMVGSQQQVLVHLGRELELHQAPVVAAAMAQHPAQKAQIVKAKSSSKSRSAPRKTAVTPALNL